MSVIQRLLMANSPIPDQSEDFRKSGMVLITDPRADYYLNKIKRVKKDKEKETFRNS